MAVMVALLAVCLEHLCVHHELDQQGQTISDRSMLCDIKLLLSEILPELPLETKLVPLLSHALEALIVIVLVGGKIVLRVCGNHIKPLFFADAGSSLVNH